MTEYLKQVSLESTNKYNQLKRQIDSVYSRNPVFANVCIFACGSMGRFDMTNNSDLDLFFIEDSSDEQKVSELHKHVFFAELYKINKDLGYKMPSRNGAFWRFTQKSNLLDIGSNLEDYNNSFTARLLLILESKPLFNDHLYDSLVSETVKKYFCDYNDNQDNFFPLFMMNDILRYWYTLTLNYEFRRDISDDVYKKHWRRLKLKFARLLTCYSLFLCLFEPKINQEYVIKCIKMTPMERIEHLGATVPNAGLVVEKIEAEYEWFLKLRKYESEWWAKSENKKSAYEHADTFHNLVTHNLTQLVANTNMRLREKTELHI